MKTLLYEKKAFCLQSFCLVFRRNIYFWLILIGNVDEWVSHFDLFPFLVRYNEAYTWHSVDTAIHNIIVGKLWVEFFGHTEIVNHRTGHKCSLNFRPAGWFGRDLHKVDGYIIDKK